jgi:hypothetical protein
MNDCKNCIVVKKSLESLSKGSGFSMLGSQSTITCKQGHKVFA